MKKRPSFLELAVSKKQYIISISISECTDKKSCDNITFVNFTRYLNKPFLLLISLYFLYQTLDPPRCVCNCRLRGCTEDVVFLYFHLLKYTLSRRHISMLTPPALISWPFFGHLLQSSRPFALILSDVFSALRGTFWCCDASKTYWDLHQINVLCSNIPSWFQFPLPSF